MLLTTGTKCLAFLFGLMLFIHGKQLRACRDGQLIKWRQPLAVVVVVVAVVVILQILSEKMFT